MSLVIGRDLENEVLAKRHQATEMVDWLAICFTLEEADSTDVTSGMDGVVTLVTSIKVEKAASVSFSVLFAEPLACAWPMSERGAISEESPACAWPMSERDAISEDDAKGMLMMENKPRVPPTSHLAEMLPGIVISSAALIWLTLASSTWERRNWTARHASPFFPAGPISLADST